MRIGYLTGSYPAPSHSFIASEVAALRARGVEVHTFTVHRTRPDQLLSALDRRAAAETRAIQPPDLRALLRAHAGALRTAPGRYVGTLARALRLSPGGLRERLWHAFYFAEAILVWSWCEDSGIRHLHAHFANASSMICLLAADFGGWTWSFTMHGPTEFDDVSRFRLAEKVRRAGFVACISDFCRSQLMKLTPPHEWPKLTVVRCGLDFSSFDPRPSPSFSEPLRILCVGRLVADKGQRQLVEAMAILRERGIDARAELVGDGPEREALERLVRDTGLTDRVTLRGAVAHDQIAAHYNDAHVFCLPSFAEGLPVSIMEAMALERPVVTTQIMGIPELVGDPETGRLVAPGRAGELADALASVAHDPELRARMGRAGRERVMRRHDVGRAAERLAGLFAEATG
jgi:glycosyltransferase involved in cell wall biosynthesis